MLFVVCSNYLYYCCHWYCQLLTAKEAVAGDTAQSRLRCQMGVEVATEMLKVCVYVQYIYVQCVYIQS